MLSTEHKNILVFWCLNWQRNLTAITTGLDSGAKVDW